MEFLSRDEAYEAYEALTEWVDEWMRRYYEWLTDAWESLVEFIDEAIGALVGTYGELQQVALAAAVCRFCGELLRVHNEHLTCACCGGPAPTWEPELVRLLM